MNLERTFRHKNLLVFIILLFISFVLMSISQKKFTIELKSIAYGVLYPFHFVGVKSLTGVKEFFTSIENNRKLREELAYARILLEQYERTQYEFEEIKRENERLKSLIGIQSKLEYETVIAEVIAKSPQNFYRTIVVNRGSTSGVRKWMPVVAYQDGVKCVVGKVVDVQRFSSRIQPIIEQSSYTGAMLQKSRFSGILQGQSPLSEYCILQYIDRGVEINYGDPVVTSGMGGIFPKGILIGEVVSVSKKGYGIFQEAMVKPKVDFGRLEEVYIITKTATEDFVEFLQAE